MKHVAIIGCGDIGRRVAHLWQARGVPLTVTARSPDSATALCLPGMQALVLDLDRHPDSPPTDNALSLAGALVYYFVPPAASGTDDIRMQHFIDYLDRNAPPARVIAISTSGVYGDRGGATVTEETPPRPQTDRGRRRLAGENRLRAWGRAHKVAVVILRVGGIYAANRLPLQRLRNRAPVLHEHLAPRTNRIHADDLARVCVAAADAGRADRIYNVCDGQDSNMTEYFNTIADHLGLPRPPCVDWAEAERSMSAGMLSYLRESRHMDNSSMRNELGIELLYPDLRTALATTLETAPGERT